jgi:hypothetical protein
MAHQAGTENRITVVGRMVSAEIRRSGHAMIWLRYGDAEDRLLAGLSTERFQSQTLAIRVPARVLDAFKLFENDQDFAGLFTEGSIFEVEGEIQGVRVVLGGRHMDGMELQARALRRVDREVRTFTRFTAMGWVEEVDLKHAGAGVLTIKTSNREPRAALYADPPKFFTDFVRVRITRRAADAFKEQGVDPAKVVRLGSHVGLVGGIQGLRQDTDGQAYYGQDLVAYRMVVRKHGAGIGNVDTKVEVPEQLTELTAEDMAHAPAEIGTSAKRAEQNTA